MYECSQQPNNKRRRLGIIIAEAAITADSQIKYILTHYNFDTFNVFLNLIEFELNWSLLCLHLDASWVSNQQSRSSSARCHQAKADCYETYTAARVHLK